LSWSVTCYVAAHVGYEHPWPAYTIYPG